MKKNYIKFQRSTNIMGKIKKEDLESMKEVEEPKEQDMNPKDPKNKLKPLKANLGLLFMKKAKSKGAKGAELLSPTAMATKFFDNGGEVEVVKGEDYIKDLL